MNLLIQALSTTLLLYQNMSLRQIRIYAFGISVHNNLFLEIHLCCCMLKTQNFGQKLYPIGSAILVLISPAVPTICELSGSLSLL